MKYNRTIISHDKKRGVYNLRSNGSIFYSDWCNTFHLKQNDIADLPIALIPYNIKFSFTDVDLDLRVLSQKSGLLTIADYKTPASFITRKQELVLENESYQPFFLNNRTYEIILTGFTIGELVSKARHFDTRIMEQLNLSHFIITSDIKNSNSQHFN
jgi:hypothetical protein